jgi:hypothetical protein
MQKRHEDYLGERLGTLGEGYCRVERIHFGNSKSIFWRSYIICAVSLRPASAGFLTGNQLWDFCQNSKPFCDGCIWSAFEVFVSNGEIYRSAKREFRNDPAENI